MNLIEQLALLNKLIVALGNVTLGEAKTWLEVEENARRLKDQKEPEQNEAEEEANKI